MTDFEVDQRTHQRVMDFISYRPDGPPMASVDEQNSYQSVSDEVPNTIAQQTAVDLVEFLRGGNNTNQDRIMRSPRR